VIVLQLLLAVTAAGCLLALSIYIYLAVKGGSVTLYSTIDTRLMNWKRIVFLVCAALGFLTCMFQGAEAMLYWLPNSWRRLDADGQYESYRIVLASLFAALGGTAFLGFIDKATHRSIFLDIMRERARFLERIIAAIHGKDSFDAIREDIDKKLEELAKSKKQTAEWQLEHLTPNGQLAAHYQELRQLVRELDQDREGLAKQ
jgi:hypothetical protein